MSLFSRLFGSNSQPLSVERDKGGNFFYKMFSSDVNYKNYQTTVSKINAIESNMALAKVISIITDTGKLANINLYNNDKLVKINYLYDVKARPNPYQTWTVFFKEYLTWYCLGSVFYYKEPATYEVNSSRYFLDPSRFDDDTIKLFKDLGKKITVSGVNEVMKNNTKHVIKYKFNGTETQDLQLKNLTIINSKPSFSNWFESASVIDSLTKVVSNSESSLDAKNINLHFAQKFLVFSNTTVQDHQAAITGFSDNNEKEDLRNKMKSNERVLVSGAENVELKRFVDKLKQMGFDESFLNDYFLIGTAFNIPKDILESALSGATYENQEKAMVRFVEMALSPMLQEFTDVLETELQEGDEVKAEFSHLGFMRVVEVEKATKRKIDLEALKIAFELGADQKMIQEQIKIIYSS